MSGIKKNTPTETKAKEPTYKVLEECGTIATKKNGELKLRYISWNGAAPKYDIHLWINDTDEEGNVTERCGKGMTLTGEELESLYNIIKKMVEEGSDEQ